MSKIQKLVSGQVDHMGSVPPVEDPCWLDEAVAMDCILLENALKTSPCTVRASIEIGLKPL